MDMIHTNPNLPWDWKEISANPNITMNYIKNNIDKAWDWEQISSNKFIV
jgi:hypothetical protein